MLFFPYQVQSQVVAREKEELQFQLEVEGEQPESCFIHQALEFLRTRQESLSSDSSVEDITAIESGVESLALSSTDEPISSSESFSSMDDLLSPISPTTDADVFSLPKDPEDGPVQGEGDGKQGNNSEMTEGAGETAVVGDKECAVTEAAREKTDTGVGEEQTVSVEDLDISQLQPNIGTTGGQVSTYIYIYSIHIEFLHLVESVIHF